MTGCLIAHRYRRANDWHVLQAILILSHKYNAGDIHAEALFQLDLIFPSTIEAWDKRQDHCSKSGSIHTLYEPKRDCIAVANTARILDLPRIHSAALYDCCQLDGLELITGLRREDGRRDRLCEDDQVFCVRAIQRLCHIKHYMMNKVGKTPARRCERSMCEVARTVYLARINDPKEAAQYCIKPGVLDRDEWLETFLGELGACSGCIRTARRSQNEARRVVLERIDKGLFLEDHMPS